MNLIECKAVVDEMTSRLRRTHHGDEVLQSLKQVIQLQDLRAFLNSVSTQKTLNDGLRVFGGYVTERIKKVSDPNYKPPPPVARASVPAPVAPLDAESAAIAVGRPMSMPPSIPVPAPVVPPVAEQVAKNVEVNKGKPEGCKQTIGIVSPPTDPQVQAHLKESLERMRLREEAKLTEAANGAVIVMSDEHSVDTTVTETAERTVVVPVASKPEAVQTGLFPGVPEEVIEVATPKPEGAVKKDEKPLFWRCCMCLKVVPDAAASANNYHCAVCGHKGMKVVHDHIEDDDEPNLVEKAPEAPQEASQEEAKPKKKRGRPRKTPVADKAPNSVTQVLNQDLDNQEDQYAALRPDLPTQDGEDTSLDYLSRGYTCDNQECNSDDLLMRIPHPKDKGRVEATYRCLKCEHRGIILMPEVDAFNEIAQAKVADYEVIKKQAEEEKKPVKKKRKKAVRKPKQTAKEKKDETADKIVNELEGVESGDEFKNLVSEHFNISPIVANKDVICGEIKSMVLGWNLDQTVKEWERVTGQKYDGKITQEDMSNDLAGRLAGTVGIAV